MGDEADDLIDRMWGTDWEDGIDLGEDPEYVSSQTYHAGDPCPKDCGGILVLRKNKTTGIKFLGCSSFPKCKGY